MRVLWNERVACRVFEAVPNMLSRKEGKIWSILPPCGVEYAAHGGDEVVSRYSNMYLLSRHRHIHDSELRRRSLL